MTKHRSISQLLTLAVGLVIGAILGSSLLGGESGAVGASPGAARPLGGAAAPEQALSLRGVEDWSGFTSAALGGAGDGPTEAQYRVAEAAAREVVRTDAAPVPSEHGAGILEGRVETADGDGVAGVTITLERRTRPRAGGSDSSADSSSDLESVATRAAREAVERYSRGRRAVSGPDGRFRFDGLPEAMWGVSGSLDGHNVRVEAPGAFSLMTGSFVTMVAEARTGLRARVSFADGGTPSSATLLVKGRGGDGSRTKVFQWAPEEAELALTPGSYSVRAMSDLLWDQTGDSDRFAANWASRWEEIEVGGQSDEPIELVLEPAQVLWGAVRFADGFRATEMPMLIVERFDGDGQPKASDFDNAQPIWIHNYPSYARWDVEPGRYFIGIRDGWRGALLCGEVVDYQGGVQRRDLLTGRSEASNELSLRVVRSGGEPVRGVKLELREEGTSSTRQSSLGGYVDGDVTKIAAPDWSDDEDVRFFAVVADPRFAPAEVELQRGLLEYTIQVEDPAQLLVEVAGARRSEWREYLSIELTPVREQAPEGRRSMHMGGTTVGIDGTARIEGLSPGAQRLSLNLADTAEQSWFGVEIAALELTLRSGENRAVISLPPLYSFSVGVPEVADGASLRLSSIGPAAPTLSSFRRGQAQVELGTAEFVGIPAGRYRLELLDGQGKSMEIEVPCGDLMFEGSRPDAARIRITDEQGRMARMGFRDGDLLLSLDGRSLADGQAPTQDVFRLASGVHRALVLRGGREFEVVWDAAQVEVGPRGADIQPTWLDR